MSPRREPLRIPHRPPPPPPRTAQSAGGQRDTDTRVRVRAARPRIRHFALPPGPRSFAYRPFIHKNPREVRGGWGVRKRGGEEEEGSGVRTPAHPPPTPLPALPVGAGAPGGGGGSGSGAAVPPLPPARSPAAGVGGTIGNTGRESGLVGGGRRGSPPRPPLPFCE